MPAYGRVRDLRAFRHMGVVEQARDPRVQRAEQMRDTNTLPCERSR